MKVYGVMEVKLCSLLTCALMKISGRLQAPAAYPLGCGHLYAMARRLSGSLSGCVGNGNYRCLESNPGHVDHDLPKCTFTQTGSF